MPGSVCITHQQIDKAICCTAAQAASVNSTAIQAYCCAACLPQAKIQEALEAERVLVADVYGDGRHVNIDVVSAAFEGKSSVARQRMVYKVRRMTAGTNSSRDALGEGAHGVSSGRVRPSRLATAQQLQRCACSCASVATLCGSAWCVRWAEMCMYRCYKNAVAKF